MNSLIDEELVNLLKCNYIHKHSNIANNVYYVCEKSGKIASTVDCLLCEKLWNRRTDNG